MLCTLHSPTFYVKESKEVYMWFPVIFHPGTNQTQNLHSVSMGVASLDYSTAHFLKNVFPWVKWTNEPGAMAESIAIGLS